MTTNDRETRKVKIDSLQLEECCQARANVTPDRVEMFKQVFKSLRLDPEDEKNERPGCEEPPAVTACRVDGALYVIDGWHRVLGARAAGELFIRCEIIEAEDAEHAQWLAVSQNRSHGLPRSNADKKRAVRLALDCGIGVEQSTHILAGHVGVDHKTAKKHRDEWEAEDKAKRKTEPGEALGKIPNAPETVTTKDGRQYPKHRRKSSPDTASAGQEVSPEDSDEPTDEFAADAAQAAELADDYKAAAKLIGRLWNSLCDSLGAVDPVCVKVNEASRLAKDRAGAPDTTTKVQAIAS